MAADHPFLPEHFERDDESADELFYAAPRLTVHIDDAAIAALRQFFRETLPPGGDILDLMSSWRSHLPEDVTYGRVVGLGMNGVELAENPQLSERVVQDVNADPRLPFADAQFDAAVITVSVQYMVRPVEVFAEVARVLRPGGQAVVSYSDRMFPAKAVRIWRYTQSEDHARLIAAYLRYAGGFDGARAEDRSPHAPGFRDPLYIVTARRAAQPQ